MSVLVIRGIKVRVGESIFSVAAALAVLVCTQHTSFGQLPDLTTQTLQYNDVTSSNVVQSVAEDAGNEKEMEFGDYDNDGDLDVVMAVARGDFSQRRNKLYRNDDGVLVEVSGSSVIPEFSLADVSRGALFRDFDNDGWLDIVIANDSNSGTATPTSPGRTRYYRNVDGVRFVNETFRLNDLNGGVSHANAADFNGDGLIDIVLCNHPNSNQDRIAFNGINGLGPGEFVDLTGTHLPVDNEYGKHVSVADMNGDGWPDILVASHVSDNSFIYYNNNNGAGTGPGDFRYAGVGANTEMPTIPGGILERGMVPGDFNNDGRMDFYFFNEGASGTNLSDAVYVNTGNDADNRAMFDVQLLSPILEEETTKATVADMDQDGRVDIVVMSEDFRPHIFRNTSENGEVSFVEWTSPAISAVHVGWDAQVGNLSGDGRPDLLIGAFNDDFLFEGVSETLVTSDLAGGMVLPDFHNDASISLQGEVEFGESLTLIATEIPFAAEVKVLMRSFGDLRLTARVGDTVVASSDRIGHGSDEVLEFTMPVVGNVIFEIEAAALSFDGNGDGQVDLLDINSFVDCLSGNSTDCEPFDIFDNGQLTLLLVNPLIDAVSSNKTSEEFVIEFLSRSN